jgi:hypothetical protein
MNQCALNYRTERGMIDEPAEPIQLRTIAAQHGRQRPAPSRRQQHELRLPRGCRDCVANKPHHLRFTDEKELGS